MESEQHVDRILQVELDPVQPLRAQSPIDSSMVAGSNHVHHLSNSDAFRALEGKDSGFGLPNSQNRRLRRVNNRTHSIDTVHSQVTDRGSTSDVLRRIQFPLSCSFDDIFCLLCQLN